MRISLILRRIRWVNLLIAASTLFISNYFLVRPIGMFNDGISMRTDLDFLLLLLSVLFIMAGGNVVNDINDEKTDEVNGRENLATALGRKKSWTIYIILSFTGLILGLVLCLKIGSIALWIIHVAAALLLFWYSAYLKGTPLGGNMLVALLCGFLPLLPLIVEKRDYTYFLQPEYFMISFMSLFAILTTLVRELVKDMEDAEGDAAAGKLSLVIVLGEKATRSLSVVMLCCTLILFLAMALTSGDLLTPIYMSLFLAAPSVILIYKLIRSYRPSSYHKISTGMKFIMVSGLGYIVLYHYTCL